MASVAGAWVCLIHKKTEPRDASLPSAPAEIGEALVPLIRAGVVSGKSNELVTQLLPGPKPRRLLVIGLGSRESFSSECLREAGATLGKALRKQRIRSAAVFLPRLPRWLPAMPGKEPAGPAIESAVESITTGFLLGSFHYSEYKGKAADEEKQEPPPEATELTIVVADQSADVKAALRRGIAVAKGQNFARTIASRPGNDVNPLSLAKIAQQMAKEVGLKLRVLDENQMKRLGMGGITAVGAGSSATPPRMIVLEWPGRKSSGRRKPIENRKTRPELVEGSKIADPLLVVGKAITFDTGGVSIKPAEKMGRMIFDKCGGMAVLGLMVAVARLKLPIRIVGILASAENHISETAYRPGDILRMYNGVTVEVTNTDAEGRLVLADALAWGIETYKPAAVLDLATLTGGVVVALGRTMAGVMSNDDKLVAELQSAADRAGEKLWRLPLGQEQKDQIKSDPADIVNSAGRDAHPLQGGAFLSHFAPEKTPWAHLDIAGVADTEKEQPLYTKGATGWGVRTLVQWVINRTRG